MTGTDDGLELSWVYSPGASNSIANCECAEHLRYNSRLITMLTLADPFHPNLSCFCFVVPTRSTLKSLFSIAPILPQILKGVFSFRTVSEQLKIKSPSIELLP